MTHAHWIALVRRTAATVAVAASFAGFASGQPPIPGAAAGAPPSIASAADEQQQLDELEAYLKLHPADEKKREAIIIRYSDNFKRHIDRLEYHTLEMVKYHPANENIAWRNSSAFLYDPRFARRVISQLEAQAPSVKREQNVYWLIAYISAKVAIPPDYSGAAGRERFLEYYGLPQNTRFPSKPDAALAEKSIHYYRKALAAVKNDRFYTGFYSEQLANLLMDLHRTKDALAVFRTAMPQVEKVEKAGFLLSYGLALREVGQTRKAVSLLKEVRPNDSEWDEGPGCATDKAETALGEIALEQRNISEARKWLLSSCRVQRCCHNMSGLPMSLAKRLLAKGQYDCVIAYCSVAVTKFYPGDKEAKDILRRAKAAKLRTANCAKT